jgi:phosphatidylserine synthase 1
VKPSHPFTLARLALITLSSAPGIRQYYLYVTDPHVNRIGSQLWLFVATIGVEFVVVAKFGSEILEKTMFVYLVWWISWLILGSFLLLVVCLLLEHRYQRSRQYPISCTPVGICYATDEDSKLKSQ